MTDTPDLLRKDLPAIEWFTLGVICATYAVWALGTTVLADLWLPLGIVVTGLAIAQFSSVQHEVLHGHPFRHRLANEALVFPALNLCVPYGRFRDTHLAHHHDPIRHSADHTKVMADDHHRNRPVTLQPFQGVQHKRLYTHVKTCRGFIQKQNIVVLKQ